MNLWLRLAVVASVIIAPLLFMAGVFVGRQSRQEGLSIAANSTIKHAAPPSFSPEELEQAKAFDVDLAKQCPTDSDECKRARQLMLLQAQVRLGGWGYGIKFTAEPNSETVGAIRLYQQRNGLPATGKLDGLTIVRMEADEEATAPYPFTLPPFYFHEKWWGWFLATGVFRDTSTGGTTGPMQIKCDQNLGLCFEEESTKLTPNVSMMTIKQWTGDRIVAEDLGGCYRSQLIIQRGSKTVVHTWIKTSDDKGCPSARIYSEELVDGVDVQIERSNIQSAAIRRIKLLSASAEAVVKPRPPTAGKSK